ncbi:MAG: class II glutamine amidotransferase [bacterium]|nr:class II glutamine amidotransferase [bacterium]
MCRLFGYIGEEKNLGGYLGGNKNSLLSQSHGTISATGPGPIEHRHGWGIYWKRGNTHFYERRGMEEFDDNDFLNISLETKASLAVAHIRNASKGTDFDRKFAHPFVEDRIILAHNGTIKPYIEEGKEKGTTDTGIVMERLKRDWKERDYKSLVLVLFNIITEVGDDYTAMNMIISNEKDLFVLCRFKDMGNYAKKYYTMKIKSKSKYTLVASQQIDEDFAGWEDLENNSLIHINENGLAGKTLLTK